MVGNVVLFFGIFKASHRKVAVRLVLIPFEVIIIVLDNVYFNMQTYSINVDVERLDYNIHIGILPFPKSKIT
jgi:hypothetical protein